MPVLDPSTAPVRRTVASHGAALVGAVCTWWGLVQEAARLTGRPCARTLAGLLA